MAATHARSFAAIRGVSLAACCDIDEKRAQAFARRWRFPRWYVGLPGDAGGENRWTRLHCHDRCHARSRLPRCHSLRAAVLCEKPLATTLADARKMRDAAAARRGHLHGQLQLPQLGGRAGAAALVRGGGVGRVMHVEASYLQSWLAQDAWGDWRTNPTFTWRLSRRHGSGGVLGDIGCHIYDLVGLLCGDIREISCKLSTFSKGVKGNRIGPYVLDANDSFVSTIGLAAGGIGTVHATRWATGHLNSIRVRVYGDEGAVEVDLDRDPGATVWCRERRRVRTAAWRVVPCKPVPSQYERFITSVRTGKNDVSDFDNGLRVQAYLDASEPVCRNGPARDHQALSVTPRPGRPARAPSPGGSRWHRRTGRCRHPFPAPGFPFSPARPSPGRA